MNDTDVTNLVNVISPAMPIEAIAIFSQPSVTRVPQGLPQFTNLKAVSLPGNGITSANGSDFTLPLLQEIQLESNAIASLSGNFVLASPFQSDGAESAVFSLNNNAALTSLSTATFSLSADWVLLYFDSCSLTSVTAEQITLKAKTMIYIDLQSNQLTSVKLAPDTSSPLSIGQFIVLNNNNLTLVDCNDLGVNGGAASFYLSISNNRISEAKCGPGTPLDTVKRVQMDWSFNSFTSLPTGSFTLAGKVTLLSLDNQKTTFTSIEPGSLPREFVSLTLHVIILI